jgi:hypothetical protein
MHRGDDAGIKGNGLEGQEAVDAYVAQLMARIKGFPYKHIDEDPTVGAFVRDEVIAPIFKGKWELYSNEKYGAGLDLPELYRLLCGENMLLERLHYYNAIIRTPPLKDHSTDQGI